MKLIKLCMILNDLTGKNTRQYWQENNQEKTKQFVTGKYLDNISNIFINLKTKKYAELIHLGRDNTGNTSLGRYIFSWILELSIVNTNFKMVKLHPHYSFPVSFYSKIWRIKLG